MEFNGLDEVNGVITNGRLGTRAYAGPYANDDRGRKSTVHVPLEQAQLATSWQVTVVSDGLAGFYFLVCACVFLSFPCRFLFLLVS